MSSIRRKYSKEFKLEAVKLANSPGVTLKQVSEELGLNTSLLGKWRRELRQEGQPNAFPGQGNPRDQENANLKRELARIKKERDFLKQADDVPLSQSLPSRLLRVAKTAAK